MKKVNVGMLIVGCASFLCLGKDGTEDARLLSIDYSGARRCVYLAEYTSQGSFKQKETVSKKSTSVRCMLELTHKDPMQLSIKVDSISVVSDVFNEKMKKDLRETLLKSDYSLSIARGYPIIDSAAAAPGAGYLEWDLYRQLSKLLPALPEKAVKPGFTWERTLTLPLQTERGKVSCETYRAYTFAKLQGDTATITWQYTFTASKKTDSAEVFREIPVSGKGSGTAVLDVRNHCIISAAMDFTTPVARIGDVSVTWTERAEFMSVTCK
jgi:hypothetical protein